MTLSDLYGKGVINTIQYRYIFHGQMIYTTAICDSLVHIGHRTSYFIWFLIRCLMDKKILSYIYYGTSCIVMNYGTPCIVKYYGTTCIHYSYILQDTLHLITVEHQVWSLCPTENIINSHNTVGSRTSGIVNNGGI